MHIRRLIIISVLILFLDQLSKFLIMRGMAVGESIPVVKGILHLTYVRNPGAAFGILSGASEGFRVPFFVLISAVAIAVVFFFYLRGAKENPLLQVGLSLVMGGAIGNLIDRIRFHEVIDFIDFFFRQYHWPAFNVADSSISVGVTLLILDALLAARREKRERGGTP